MPGYCGSCNISYEKYLPPAIFRYSFHPAYSMSFPVLFFFLYAVSDIYINLLISFDQTLSIAQVLSWIICALRIAVSARACLVCLYKSNNCVLSFSRVAVSDVGVAFNIFVSVSFNESLSYIFFNQGIPHQLRLLVSDRQKRRIKI